jgi:hypothetical protein
MADVYCGAIRELTLLYPVAGADQLMGYAMAHELGHLLIGAGHRPNGLMPAALSKKELDALNHRHLKFNEAEQAAILPAASTNPSRASAGWSSIRSNRDLTRCHCSGVIRVPC